MLLTWDDKGVKVLIEPRSKNTCGVNVTGWSRDLEVTGGGLGIVSHAGLVLLRALADRTGPAAGLSKALASRRLLIHDPGQVLADLACAIADGAEVIGLPAAADGDLRWGGRQPGLISRLDAPARQPGPRHTRTPKIKIHYMTWRPSQASDRSA